jgi:hypothetical protein
MATINFNELFKSAHTPQDIKALFRKLSMKHHPDMAGGDTDTMQQLNEVYQAVLKKMAGFTWKADGRDHTYRYDRATETELAEMISKVISIEGVTVEIIGTWLWVSGDTYDCKSYLKECGFKWARGKKSWYFHTGSYRKFSKKSYGMDDIRSMWGSEEVDKKQSGRLSK